MFKGCKLPSVLLCSLIVQLCRGLERQERLLLNDPQVLQSQIQHLLQEVNILKTTTDQEINALKSQLASQNNEISSLRGQIFALTQQSNDRGATFTVWGKNNCPNVNGTEMIYKGFTGGKSFSEKGGGANTLCLPHDPERLPYGISVISGDDYGHLYGAEYQFSIHRVHIQEDVPCAVCRAKMASSTIMISGKHSCPVTWRKQYSGFLTSSWHDYESTEYLCLDDDPDFIEGSRRDDNGRLFYPVKTVCGSLPCPPYENNVLVGCVVCAK